MSTFMKRLTCLTLTLTLLVTLGGCKKTAAETPPPAGAAPGVGAAGPPPPGPPPPPPRAWAEPNITKAAPTSCGGRSIYCAVEKSPSRSARRRRLRVTGVMLRKEAMHLWGARSIRPG